MRGALALFALLGLILVGCSSSGGEGSAADSTEASVADAPADAPAAGDADAQPADVPGVDAPPALPEVQRPGPFGVGVRTLDLVDATRPTPASGEYPGAATRTLTTELWYPAPAGTGTPEKPARDAAFEPASEPQPLLVYLHGFMSSRNENAHAAALLASRGFVVAAVDGPLTNLTAPDGANSTEGAVGPSGALRLEVVTKGKKRQAAWLTFSGTGPELFIESMSSPVCGAQFFGALPAYSKQEEAQRFSQFDVEGRLDAFVSVLQQVEPRLRGLSLAQVGDTPVIHADVGLARKIPVPLLGSGFGRLLSISLACGASRGGVVFVDEIETGLHYATHEGVWKGLAALATGFDCQIIATTHSYEFIEAGRTALAGQGELFSYVRLGRSQEGVRAHVFAPEDLEAAVEIDLEIR